MFFSNANKITSLFSNLFYASYYFHDKAQILNWPTRPFAKWALLVILVFSLTTPHLVLSVPVLKTTTVPWKDHTYSSSARPFHLLFSLPPSSPSLLLSSPVYQSLANVYSYILGVSVENTFSEKLFLSFNTGSGSFLYRFLYLPVTH